MVEQTRDDTLIVTGYSGILKDIGNRLFHGLCGIFIHSTVASTAPAAAAVAAATGVT
jgi:hypothetical protein